MDSHYGRIYQFCRRDFQFAKAAFNEEVGHTAGYYVLLMRANIRVCKRSVFAFSAWRIKTIARRRIALMG